ncbi:MAG: hypothetical protein KDE19_10080 [Caldilineaceae bacterium]|nr:hypothetical protein [Caldilineaceae bacterium]
MVTHDSLSMFLAAIGGAVLGMLLTLLVLALANGGTLSFSGPRITQLEEYVSRVDQNVGAVSANINLVSQQAASVQQQLGAVETALRGELATQGGDLSTLNESVDTLQVTRQQFDVFMGALSSALNDMQEMTPNSPGVAPVEAAPADAPAETNTITTDTAADAESPATEMAVPQVTQSADVATDAIAVYLFVDENGDGLLDDSETNLIGIPVSLQADSGESVASQESSDAGVLFSDLAAGDYQVMVDDTLGYTLLSASTVSVTVAEDAAEGTVVYIPVAAE